MRIRCCHKSSTSYRPIRQIDRIIQQPDNLILMRENLCDAFVRLITLVIFMLGQDPIANLDLLNGHQTIFGMYQRTGNEASTGLTHCDAFILHQSPT